MADKVNPAEIFAASVGGMFDLPDPNEGERPGVTLPPSVYDKQPDPALLPFLEDVIGKELMPVLEYHANNRGVAPLALLRNELATVFTYEPHRVDGLVVPNPIPKDDQRTGSDNNIQNPAVKQLAALLRRPTINQFLQLANNLRLSNESALRLVVAKIFDAKKTIAIIADAVKAQETEDEFRRLDFAGWLAKASRK